VSTFVGIIMLFAGVVRAVTGMKAQTWGGTILSLLVGVASFLIGGLMVARPLLWLGAITLYPAVYFFVQGVMECMVALEHRPHGHWVWTLFGGVISIVLGVLIWSQWPISDAWAVGTLFGIHLIFAGWAHIAIGSAAKAVASEMQGA
jgi:uncharacterized membrane protein HdeD (DUF308 family)